MRRRTVVRRLGAATAVGLAGCLTRDDDESPNGPEPDPDDPDDEGTLRVVTYGSMVTGTNPAGPWLAEAFEDANPDAAIEWLVPESGLEHSLQRGERGAAIDADVCLGFSVGDLARIDERVGDGGLLKELDPDRIGGLDRVREAFGFGDPHGRALPVDAGYVGLVYDETEISPPETLPELLEGEYADELLAQHPRYSLPGQAFFLWTVATGAIDDTPTSYWGDLVDNGIRVHRSWQGAYEGAYLEEERPLVVSYSTDPVFGATEAEDPSRHRVSFPDDEGYALPEGVGIFRETEVPGLAYSFLEFLLTEDVQTELARRNLQFPAVEDVEVGPGFDDLAREPSDPVSLEYSDLRGTLEEWLTTWDDQFGDELVETPPPHRPENDDGSA